MLYNKPRPTKQDCNFIRITLRQTTYTTYKSRSQNASRRDPSCFTLYTKPQALQYTTSPSPYHNWQASLIHYRTLHCSLRSKAGCILPQDHQHTWHYYKGFQRTQLPLPPRDSCFLQWPRSLVRSLFQFLKRHKKYNIMKKNSMLYKTKTTTNHIYITSTAFIENKITY